MSLETRLSSFATRAATEVKALRTLINGNVSDLSALTTTSKTNLVSAINEVNASAASGGDPVKVWAKSRVEIVTLTNITLSGTQTIDGVGVVAGDRVLVAGQTTASQNGIYVVAAGAWTRATDADLATEVAGMEVAVERGLNNGGQTYRTNFSAHSSTVGSTAMNWYRVMDTSMLAASGGTTAGTVVQGNDARLVAQTQAEAENNADTTIRATTGQRLYQAIAKWSVLLAGTQTVTGAKTFTVPPAIAAVSTGTPASDAGDGAFWYDTDDAGGTQTDASALTTGTLAIGRLPTTVVHRVVYTGGAWPARPSGATCVEWVGPVVPAGMTTNDTFWSTA